VGIIATAHFINIFFLFPLYQAKYLEWQAPFPVVVPRETVERPAGLYRHFMLWRLLKQRIIHYDMTVFDFSFPFHSLPVLSEDKTE